MKAEQASTITGILAVTAIAIAFGIVLAIIITAAITGAMRKGVEFATEISRGNLNAELDVNQKDEIGQLAEAMKEMLEALRYKAEIIEKYAEGDFTTDAELASDVDGLGKSLNKMQQSLNDLLSQVNVAVEQVSAGAEQVSNASQNLSQGATEQASSLEEISSSINEINGQSRQNAENSSQANGIAKKATDDAGAGNLQMKDLVKAMEEINTSSEEIKKIIKVIDDIAFQVNLLALNANVEAARAGKYGKGFAVVAEEVRNLAVRSAEAVKETTAMVEESIKSISKGNNLVDNTAKQLESIVGGSTKVADFLSEITIASNEQAQGIDQISEALNQIDQVTQSNTASAEESASAAEELSAQAQQLKGIVGRFKLKKRLMIESRMEGDRHSASVEHLNVNKIHAMLDKKAAPARPKTADRARSKPLVPKEVIKLDDDDFDSF
jgi:methyl-accepting chemotaxis protein